MRMLEPTLGYPMDPEGIAHLDLDSAGTGGEFHIDGNVHAVNAAYIGTGVVATGILTVDAHVHADPKQLLITKIVAHLRQGGQIEGEVDLSPWLPASAAPPAVIEPAGINAGRSSNRPRRSPVHRVPPPDVISIPVNGKVIANFHDVSLDTVLDMVGQAPFQRLGLDARINGLATANWVKGDQQTVVSTACFNLMPSAKRRVRRGAHTGRSRRHLHAIEWRRRSAQARSEHPPARSRRMAIWALTRSPALQTSM